MWWGFLKGLSSEELEESVSGRCVEVDCGQEAAALDPVATLVQTQQSLLGFSLGRAVSHCRPPGHGHFFLSQ